MQTGMPDFSNLISYPHYSITLEQRKANTFAPANIFTQYQVMEKKTFAVNGMMCGHCKARIEEALRIIDGVESAEGNLADKTVTVAYDADKVTPEQMQEAVANCGRYELTL